MIDSSKVQEYTSQIIQELEAIIYGKRKKIEYLLAALFCNGHILIEDMPGTGKTALVKAVSEITNLSFKRIQFTPDLMPSDVIGQNLLDAKTREMEFHPGPIFAHLVLADNLNRATPRSQSALLEAMEEKTVTVGGMTYDLPTPFLVIATQNSGDEEGTYPLPETQLDRFLIKLSLGYPDYASEDQMLLRQLTGQTRTVKQIPGVQEFGELRKYINEIELTEQQRNLVLEITRATREAHRYLKSGASPRGTLALMQFSQSLALIRNHKTISDEIIYEAAPIVLSHRISLNFEALAEGISPDQIIEQIVKTCS